ncbi:Ste11p [Rhizophagus irregularis DAOM 197198w]|uniref:Ste11p n=3 Tax=Rhizophagus irregularis TaxID=588596 RepID=A0A015NCG3_RHIIW|nr:Ste11p [Rhizophagus irregularis DAOM 197198w]
MDLARKWCKSCHINQLKDNFINWTSGDEKIDNFIQKKQLNVMTSFDLIFEWIPYNELIEIKEIGKGELSTAIWKEGPLYYDNFEKEWMRNSYKKVVLKCLSNSQNLTDEFLNKATVSYVLIYGISQNPNTKDYILVIHITYYNKYCKECDKEYTKLDHAFCESCLINDLKINYTKWTSGNEKIDNSIQKMQLEVGIKTSVIFEWISYNEFIDIKEIGNNCLTTAIWKEGPLCYNTYEIKWMRTSHEKVCLKYLYNSQNVIDELFINKVESFLDYSYYNISTKFKPTYGCYGISQNPDTKDYILILNCEYFEEYCEKCGNIYVNKYDKWCRSCQINYLKNDFTNWTSGNGQIDNFIQKMQLKINGYEDAVFEWIPYNKFIDISDEMGKCVFTTAVWKDGLLYYSKISRKFKRKLNEKVLLKCLYNSQDFNNKCLNEIMYSIKESYGISQNPITKDFILVLQDKYYCIYCYKKYNNKFEINNKSCMLCQTSHENKKISDLIQEMKLNINYNSYYFGVIFEWVPYDQFYDLKEIGKGGFSTVYSAIWKDGLLHESDTGGYWRRKPNTRVALKCLHNSQNFLDEFINEVKAYPNQKIENILKIYGISQDPNTKNYIMVFEYAEGGSFDNYLDKNYESFDWFNGLKVLTNIINGLSEIHQKQMVHRDFHIGNILITKQEILNDFHIYSSHENNNDNDNNYNACISDMGLCRKIDDIDEASIYGVMPYVAPEVLRGKPYTQAADIYSFGMVMHFVAAGRQPFDDCAHDQVLVLNICNGIRPEINEKIAPKCYIDLMKRCWDLNPENRPNSIEVKEIIELFYNSLDQKFKKNKQHYEIEEQFKKTQEYRKENLLSIKNNNKSTTHVQAIYTSRLLNPFTKNLFSNSTVEITDFTE